MGGSAAPQRLSEHPLCSYATLAANQRHGLPNISVRRHLHSTSPNTARRPPPGDKAGCGAWELGCSSGTTIQAGLYQRHSTRWVLCGPQRPPKDESCCPQQGPACQPVLVPLHPLTECSLRLEALSQALSLSTL